MADQQAHFPELPTADREQLSLFLECGEDLRALATRTGVPLLDLLAWAVQPGIRRALAAWDSLRRRAQQVRDDADRALAREALKAAMADSTDPIEKRRAASALLRCLSPVPWDLHRRPLRRARESPRPDRRERDTVSSAVRALRESEATLARVHRAYTVPPVPPPPARPATPNPPPAPAPPAPSRPSNHAAPRPTLVSDLLASTRSPLDLLNRAGSASGPTRPRPP